MVVVVGVSVDAFGTAGDVRDYVQQHDMTYSIWLDPDKTSPYHFYQFWLNSADDDVEKWIRIFTFLDQMEIEKLVREHQQDPSKRILQKRLAQELTIFVHGVDQYAAALETTEKLFSRQNAPAESLSLEDLEGMEGIIHLDFSKEKLRSGIDPVSFLSETTIFPSKSEARKMILNGGVSINRHKLENITEPITINHLLHNKYLLVQKGKKNYYLVKAD